MHAAWKKATFESVKKKLYAIAAVSLVAAVAIPLVAYGGLHALTVVGFFAALFVMASSLIDPLSRWRRGQSLHGAIIGMAIAHFGVGLFTLGLTGVESYRIEKDISLAPGESATIAGYEFRFLGVKDVAGPNYTAVEAEVALLKNGRQFDVLKTQKRTYNVQKQPMTEAGIAAGPTRDLFVALGEDLGLGKWSMRIQYKPLIRFIWLGALVMALGGALAGLDRRYRVRRAASDVAADAAAARGAG
jgi:cytochrome c-type biogenesis protein CcmF